MQILGKLVFFEFGEKSQCLLSKDIVAHTQTLFVCVYLCRH